MGIIWLKSLRLVTGHANVMGHLDHVLKLLASGALNVDPLVSREMKLDDAAEAYAAYDRREALKIVLRA
jgi:threonine dehydrogenase-like Zn-dependent dehydrogenase